HIEKSKISENVPAWIPGETIRTGAIKRAWSPLRLKALQSNRRYGTAHMQGGGGSFGAVSWNAENLRFSAPPLADLDNLRCEPLPARGSRNIAPIQFLSGLPS